MRIARAGLSLIVVALVTVACSGADTTAEPTQGGSAAGPADGAVTVTIAGFAFEPSSVTVTQGDSITVRNEDPTAHTFTMDDGSIDESLDPGESVEVTPTTAGAFHCTIHASMTGTLSFG